MHSFFALFKIYSAAEVCVCAAKDVVFGGDGAVQYRSFHLLQRSHQRWSRQCLVGIAISVAIENVAHERFVRDVLGDRDGVGELGELGIGRRLARGRSS